MQQSLDNKTAINIALLGYGGGNHDGAYLTDSIMVVHIDPKTQKVFLISIPRDIWVKIPTNGTDGNYWKINASYELGLDDADYPNKQTQFKGTDGGGHLAEYMVSQITGLPINYFVGMDFSGFKHTIDTLGGVDITVETAFTDSQYPIDGKETDLCGHDPSEIPQLDQQAASTSPELVYPCRYENLHFNAGKQHMDGETALSYVRSRHSLQDGTDFGRAKRQRNLLVAVKQKIFSAGFIPQIIPFISSLGDDFRTDLALDDVKTFLANANVLNTYQVQTLALTDQN
ncbi:MAG: LCP family protein, partial [Patescibacteria group bacterium]|nr:LCP family protein [Patescibacteria group bacterium]